MGYDSAATRQRILEAAPRSRGSASPAAPAEFAEHGIAGARVDRIAERAPANKASI